MLLNESLKRNKKKLEEPAPEEMEGTVLLTVLSF